MNIEYHTINELEWRCTEEREEHMGIVNVVCGVIGKMYTEKKVAAELESIKKASGLKEQDWNAIWESISHYPEEVQTVLEAKNEDHVRLYDKDKQDVWAILDETKQLIDKEVPELFWLDFFNTIQLYTCQPIEHIYTTERVKKWSMGDLLYCIQNFLYGAESNRDIQLDTQVIFNYFENLIDETDKNVRIAQKGKDGEDYVGEVLRQYGENFHFLENIVIPAYEESGKTSETDVYVVNSKGIFVCEVKNYGDSGQILYMPDKGEWQILNAHGRLIANKPSAFEQNERHCNATRSFLKDHLGIEVPIYSVVIIANNGVQIQNENPNEHIVIRAQQIRKLVECCHDAIDEETQKKIIETFEENKLDANDFPVQINADKARYLQKLVKEYIPYLKENVKMAKAYEKEENKLKKITWAVIIALIILTMMPLVKEGEGLVILLGIMAWLEGYIANTKLSTAFAIAAIILLPIWILTLNNVVAAIGLVSMILSFWLTDKHDKKEQERENNQN